MNNKKKIYCLLLLNHGYQYGELWLDENKKVITHTTENSCELRIIFKKIDVKLVTRKISLSHDEAYSIQFVNPRELSKFAKLLKRHIDKVK